MMQRHRYSSDMPTSTADLADTTRAALETLASPLVADFLVDWPNTVRQRRVDPNTLPVLRCLRVIGAALPLAPGLIRVLLESASRLAWRQTYTAQELGADFLDNYGWTEVLGLRGPYHSDRLACGFLLLGPRTHYPRHQHAAEELYVPLYGRADWLQGDTVWRCHDPGTVVHHRALEPHAMRTRDEPLLAVYLWRGGDLAAKSRIVES